MLADFQVEIPLELEELKETLELKWILHINGGSTKKGAGLGIRLVSPTGEALEQYIKLAFHGSNNEALIASLRLAQGVGAKSIQTYAILSSSLINIAANTRQRTNEWMLISNKSKNLPRTSLRLN